MSEHIEEKLAKDIQEFFEAHPTLFFFVGDPASDTMISGYDHRVIARRILTSGKKQSNEISEALNFKVGKKARGQLMMKFAAVLHNLARDREDNNLLQSIVPKGRKKAVSKT